MMRCRHAAMLRLILMPPRYAMLFYMPTSFIAALLRAQRRHDTLILRRAYAVIPCAAAAAATPSRH